MPFVAKIGTEISHGGSVTSGSPTTNDEGTAIARVGDDASCNVHGSVTITQGSPTMTDNGAAVARVGDELSCGATLTSTGASTKWDLD